MVSNGNSNSIKITTIFLIIVLAIFMFLIPASMVYSYVNMNESELTEFNSCFNESYDVISSNYTYYMNITVLDKKFTKGFIEDDYDIVYRDNDEGYVHRRDDMQLYYDVEIGKNYNISVCHGYKTIIEI